MLRLTAMILWPAFLVAIIADDLAFFGAPIELPRLATYTLGFFFFWLFGALASMMTCYLVRLPDESQPPF